MRQITAGELKERLERAAADCFLLDVREPWEYELAAIPGSRLIPMGEIPGRALQELEEESPILVLCHHGMRSLSVAAWLRQQGFEKAQSIRGGIHAWSNFIDPTIRCY